MKRILAIITLALVASAGTLVAQAQAPSTSSDKDAVRNATRDKLRQLLETTGQRKEVNATFRLSEKQPYNFVAVMRDELTNAESLEVVISVTASETIGFRVYPHFKGDYINVEKVSDGIGLMRKLLHYSDRNFLYWGIDETGDAFAGYTFTLESGFPSEAIVIVLRSIRSTDKFVGEMRPFIEGNG